MSTTTTKYFLTNTRNKYSLLISEDEEEHQRKFLIEQDIINHPIIHYANYQSKRNYMINLKKEHILKYYCYYTYINLIKPNFIDNFQDHFFQCLKYSFLFLLYKNNTESFDYIANYLTNLFTKFANKFKFLLRKK